MLDKRIVVALAALIPLCLWQPLLLLPAVALSLLLCICVAFDELGEAMSYIHDNRGNPEAVYPPEK
tara:strand:- start:10559 stop:10756 length:198 start_codon:yes stop_codon:yes gene_type:complete